MRSLAEIKAELVDSAYLVAMAPPEARAWAVTCELVTMTTQMLAALEALVDHDHLFSCLAGRRGQGQCAAACERTRAAIRAARGEG